MARKLTKAQSDLLATLCGGSTLSADRMCDHALVRLRIPAGAHYKPNSRTLAALLDRGYLQRGEECPSLSIFRCYRYEVTDAGRAALKGEAR